MKEVNITENDKKNLKWMSRLIAILTKIGRICIYVAIACLILVMSITPTLINHTKVKNNEIKFSYKESSLVIKIKNNKTYFYSDNDKVVSEKGTELYDYIVKYFDKYSNKQLIGYSEAFLLITVAYLFITTILLKYVEKLFNNISRNKTPFTCENVSLFKNVIKYKITSMILLLAGMISFDMAFDGPNPFSHTSLNIIGLLMIVVIYYIFKYGCKLQNDSKETLYKEQ